VEPGVGEGRRKSMEVYRVHSDELEWVPADFPRAQIKVLFMDPKGGGQALLLRMEPFCVMPSHTHASDEIAYILDGCLLEEAQGERLEYRKDHFAYFPSGAEHGPFTTGEEGCLVLSVFNGPL
jgi:quercetin dioxygenase-like cupin family protein